MLVVSYQNYRRNPFLPSRTDSLYGPKLDKLWRFIDYVAKCSINDEIFHLPPSMIIVSILLPKSTCKWSNLWQLRWYNHETKHPLIFKGVLPIAETMVGLYHLKIQHIFQNRQIDFLHAVVFL